MQPVNNKYIPVNNIHQNNSYQSTMARFHSILNDKLGGASRSEVTIFNSVKGQAVQTSADQMEMINAEASNKPLILSPSSRSSIAANPALNAKSNSGNSVTKINDVLVGTPMQGLGQTFKKAEQKTGVNAYVLTSIAILESNYGKSSIAQNKHNLFGFMAYDDSPYASAKSYATFEDGIEDVAKYLSEHYLTEGGKYYKGNSVYAIGQNYATNPAWGEKVNENIEYLVNED